MHRTIVAVILLLASPNLVIADEKKAPAKGIDGHWLGNLQVGPAVLRLGFNFEKKDDAYRGTLDSPDQGATDIPLTSVTEKDGVVTATLKEASASYEGKLNDKGTQLSGTWKQGNLELPLDLKRLDKKPSYDRPQDPKKPYPYAEEEVVYENAAADHKLGATLTLPEGKGPFPAVVMITGSGPQDRNQALLGHRPFLVWADYLTRRGVAVLRTDDRGVGKSTGKFFGATSADFATDALAGVAYLKTRKEIDHAKIGLMGHSEGGLVAPLAAVQSKDVAFIVLLAGPGTTGETIMLAQTKLMSEAAKAPKDRIEWNTQLQKSLLAIFKEDKDDDSAEKKMKAVVEEMMKKVPEEDRTKLTNAIKMQLPKAHFAWTRFFLTHDPTETLRKVKVPVLAICGELDMQVPSKENLAGIARALADAQNGDFAIKEFAKLNHLFQNAKTGALSEYAAIEETVSPSVLEFVADWVRLRTK